MSQNSKSIQLQITLLDLLRNSRSFTLTADQSFTVHQFKQNLSKNYSIAIESQVIFHGSLALSNDQLTLQDCGVAPNDNLTVLALGYFTSENSKKISKENITDTILKKHTFEEHVRQTLLNMQKQKKLKLDENTKAISVDSKGNMLLGTDRGSVQIYNVRTLQKVNSFEKIFDKPVLRIYRNYAAASDGKIVQFDDTYKKQKTRWRIQHEDIITAIIFERQILEGARSSSHRAKPEIVWSISYDKTIKQCELVEGKDVKVMKSLNQEVVPTSLTLPRDKDGIIVGYIDGSFKWYNYQDEEKAKSLIHRDKIIFIKEVDEGFLSCSEDGSIYVSIPDPSTKQFKVLRTFRNMNENVTISAVSITPFEAFGVCNYLMVGLSSGEVRCYDVENGSSLAVNSPSKDPHNQVTSVCSFDNNTIISGLYDGEISIQSTTDHLFGRLDHPNDAENVTQLCQNEQFIVAGVEKSLAIWDKKTLERKALIEDQFESNIRQIEIAQNGKFFAAGAVEDKEIKIFSLETFKFINSFVIKEDDSLLYSFTISPNCKMIAFSSLYKKLKLAKNKLRVYNFGDQNPIKEINIPGYDKQRFLQIQFTNDNKYLVVADDKTRSLLKINLETKQVKIKLENLIDESNPFAELEYPRRFSMVQNNKQCLVYHSEQFEVVDFEKGETINHFNVKRQNPPHFLLSNDGKYAYVSNDDEEVELIDLRTKQKVFTFTDISEETIEPIIDLSVDGKYLLGSGGTSEIKIMRNPVSDDQVSLISHSEDEKQFDPFSIQNPFFLFKFIKAVDEYLPDGTLDKESTSYKKRLEFIHRIGTTTIYPYRWNILHLISIFCPQLSLIDFCLKEGIRFTLDKYGYSPFHYLIVSENVNKGMITEMLNDFIQSPMDFAAAEDCDDIMRSLMLDLPYILENVNHNFLNPYLDNTLGDPQTFRYQAIPQFGKLRDTSKDNVYHVQKNLIFDDELKNEMVDTRGNEVLSVKAIQVPLDYSAHSNDMLWFAKILSTTTDQHIFESRGIQHLLKYIWLKNRGFHVSSVIYYAIAVCLLSIFVGEKEESSLPGLVAAIMSIICLVFEILQVVQSFTFQTMLSKWVLFNILADAFVIVAGFTGIDIACSIAVVFAYVKLVGLLRVWKAGRRGLILVSQMFKDLKGMLALLLLLTLGFGLANAQYATDKINQGHEILDTFGSVFGSIDFSEMPVGNIIISIIGLIVLCAIFFNALIAAMVSTTEKVQYRYQMYEGRERALLALQSISFYKFLGLGTSSEKSYLFVFESNLDDAHNKKGVWAGNLQGVKKQLRQEMQLLIDSIQGLHGRQLKEELRESNQGLLMEFEKKLESISADIGGKKQPLVESERSSWT